jgi:hypothetical protein
MSNIPFTNKWNDPDSNWGGKASGLGQIGSGIMGLFGNHSNPADAANKYINQIPGQTNQYYQPWNQAGQNMIPGMTDQYNQLMNDPGGKYNKIGESYHQSPGFQFALQQALGGAGHAAAAGGMAGSPQHEQQNMGIATGLANQDYNNYMQGATGLYNQGLNGGENMMNRGAQAGNNQANMIAQTLAQQGSNAAIGQMQHNQNQGNAFSNIASGIGSFFM